jgi:hypothetical protein
MLHSTGGPLNDLRRQVGRNGPEERPYMPPFAGNGYEKQGLIYYLKTPYASKRSKHAKQGEI